MTEPTRIQDLPIGVRRIASERAEQIELHGYASADDAQHLRAELIRAACAYLAVASADAAEALGVATAEQAIEEGRQIWPWAAELFKPSADPRKNLAKAGALIAAEIDRLHAAGVRHG